MPHFTTKKSKPEVEVTLEQGIDGVYVLLNGIRVLNFAQNGIWRYYLEAEQKWALRQAGVSLEHLEPLSPGGESIFPGWKVIAMDPGKEK